MPAPPNVRDQQRAQRDEPKTTYKDLGDGSVSGNLTRDPDLRFTPDGRAITTLRVAETERVKDEQTGQWGDGPTQFYDVVGWGDLGLNISECLQQGDRIAAVGKWQQQDWTGDDGTPKTKTVLVARDLGPSLLFRKAALDRTKRKGPQTQ